MNTCLFDLLPVEEAPSRSKPFANAQILSVEPLRSATVLQWWEARNQAVLYMASEARWVCYFALVASESAATCAQLFSISSKCFALTVLCSNTLPGTLPTGSVYVYERLILTESMSRNAKEKQPLPGKPLPTTGAVVSDCTSIGSELLRTTLQYVQALVRQSILVRDL